MYSDFVSIKTVYSQACVTLVQLYHRHQKLLLMLALGLFCMLFSLYASAIAVPKSGSFAFDVYDVIVNKILKGPIGFVGGLATIVIGAAQLTKSWMLAVLGILSGTVVIKADSIVTSLGVGLHLL
ncbi:MAG: hypothetical protein P8176_13490 [Gammaproteobacteria bacterium]